MSEQQQWQRVAQRLRDILQTDVVWGKRSVQPNSLRNNSDKAIFFSVDGDRGLWVVGSINARERQLIAMLIETQSGHEQATRIKEPKARIIDWLHDVDQSRHALADPPELEELVLAERVPFYIVLRGKPASISEKEVSRVLQPFFDGQVWVLRLSAHEYLMLPLASLVYEGDEVEEWQEVLWHWAEGLVELFASELGENVRVIVHPPVETVEALGLAWLDIKQTLSLGPTMQAKQNVLATWDMALERLLNGLPEEGRRAFLEDVASESHSWWRDTEMRETLETFFRLNLNVSETARQLFLHRNSLLYRLGKLKQETGRDVRQFEEAMLIHLALLLTANKV